MTRSEYKKQTIMALGYSTAFTEKLAFPRLLTTIACDLFLIGDMDSPLAQETRRRLTQLKNIGWTDD